MGPGFPRATFASSASILAIKAALAYGEFLVITNDQSHDRLRAARVFQHMLQTMGGKGVQYLYESLEDKPGLKRKAVDAEEKRPRHDPRDLTRIAEGYAYMRGPEAPKSNNRGQINEWADIKVNDPSCVLYNWPEGKVKEYLKCLMLGRQTAKTIDFWILTLKDFKPWFLDTVLSKMIGKHRSEGIWWIGRTQCGKSAGSKTLAMAISKREVDLAALEDLAASIVTAKYVDMFRGEPNTVFKPAILDDYNARNLAMEMLKAILNPSEEDALLWARWGGAGFDMGMFRQCVTNAYNKGVKINPGLPLSHALFLQLIEPSVPKEADAEDVEAVLRRANIIVITPVAVVYRVATREEVDVPTIGWSAHEDVDILTPQAKDLLIKYKNGSRDLRQSFEADMQWSLDYIRRCVDGLPIPRSATLLSRDSTGAASSSSVHPELVAPGALEMKVKKEKVASIFRKLKESAVAPIELSDSEPSQVQPEEQYEEEDPFGLGGGFDD